MLTHTDVLELLGPRPFEMSDNYKEFVDTNHQWASRIKVSTAAEARGQHLKTNEKNPLAQAMSRIWGRGCLICATFVRQRTPKPLHHCP